jgi:3-ketosteroid 9alpha-monooxygenase subunit A
MHYGWYQVAFERELGAGPTEVSFAGRALMLVATQAGPVAFDRHCPHRGANLACGGRYRDEAILCPFHGRRIGLGTPGEDGFFVRRYRTLTVGGLIFVLLDERFEHGLAARMTALDRDHYFVPGFTIQARCRPELVIENAFDRRHFHFVHGLSTTPDLILVVGEGGELAVRGRFSTTSKNSWQKGSTSSAAPLDFLARVYSPAICVTELGDPAGRPYLVVTTATPIGDSECLIRVSLALPTGAGQPDPAYARALLRDSRTSIEQDRAIWENLDTRYTRQAPDDDLVRAFYAFCGRLAEAGGP